MVVTVITTVFILTIFINILFFIFLTIIITIALQSSDIQKSSEEFMRFKLVLSSLCDASIVSLMIPQSTAAADSKSTGIQTNREAKHSLLPLLDSSIKQNELVFIEHLILSFSPSAFSIPVSLWFCLVSSLREQSNHVLYDLVLTPFLNSLLYVINSNSGVALVQGTLLLGIYFHYL